MNARLSVIIDRVKVDDIWPRQIKVFQVSPGDQRIRLDSYGFLRGSGELDVSLAAGEKKKFACFTNVIGYAAIRPATAEDVAGMKRWKPQAVTPENLAEDEPK